MNQINNFKTKWWLLSAFVKRDLKLKYTGSLIGLFWALVHPIILLSIYTFVFSIVLKVKFGPHTGITNFALYLFCGMIPFTAVCEALREATSSITENTALIKKQNFPLELLPVYSNISNLIGSMIWLSILTAATGYFSTGITDHVLLILFIMPIQLLFTFGLSLLFSTINVYFKDTKQLMEVFIIIWMFITPIFYPASDFPKELKLILVLNPMSHLVGIYRECILNHRIPNLNSVLIFSTVSLFIFSLGWYIFNKKKNEFSDYV